MNELPNHKPGFWNRVWNDPLHFCSYLMLLSILGLIIIGLLSDHLGHQSAGVRHDAVIVSIILGLGVVTGFAGMVLSLIPPVRRLLTRLLARRIFWLACVITFIFLLYAEEDWRGWHALKQYEQQGGARGVKFGLAEVVPPAVPDDQNFALTPIVSSSYASMLDKHGHELNPRDTNVVNRLYMRGWAEERLAPSPNSGGWMDQKITDLKSWQDYYRALAAKTNQFAIPPQPGSPAADVLLALGKYNADIEELRQASRLPASRFPLTYDRDEPAGILLPHLAPLKITTLMLRLRACAELQNNQADQALADVKLMLYLNGAIRTEPFLITHLVRIAMLDISLQPIYEGLAAHLWSEAQLNALDSELARQDFLADYQTAMQGELDFDVTEIEYMRRNRDFGALDYSEDGQLQPSSSEIGLQLYPSGFFYQNELQLARMQLEYVLPVVDMNKRILSPATVRQNNEAITDELRQYSYNGALARMALPAVFNSVKRFTRAQAHLDLARVAIALERFRLAHGEFPDSLDVLAPQFLDPIPHDVINGQPLHYRRTNDGQFVLYSVGWNETDDGGVVGHRKEKKGRDESPDMEEGDWVWEYPAK
ncbi:MAG TPA: hypothetical protein VNX46_18720 [Candidatus Acidoferrum sp.]|nr:hypothetical protein [Candidatus Acidoferrum sp.]